MLHRETFESQRVRWPQAGRHILAQYDADSVVVYQAYRPAIGHFAAREQRFGGEFSLNRMSWIKPNFLWMMYRSGWATKPGQEVVLAVRLHRAAFDEMLALAVHSSFVPEQYPSQEAWSAAVKSSDVRLQWDPDHAPSGAKERRRAIQLGMRGSVLARYAHESIIDIQDITSFVTEQRAHIKTPERLICPREDVYPVASLEVREKLGLDAFEAQAGTH
tara:strand:- start:44304 stop:44957 length:654 start_codon:yes stop_codon:yes gene_type:complete